MQIPRLGGQQLLPAAITASLASELHKLHVKWCQKETIMVFVVVTNLL